MSFYGNILNRLDKFFSIIKVKDTTINATQENDAITLTGYNGVDIDISINETNKEVKIDGSALKITLSSENSDKTDGNSLIYTLKQGDNEIGDINIPLDLLLKESEIVYEDDQGKSGVFLKLVFRTAEGTGETPVYIDVNELYNIKGSTSTTIAVTVNDGQEITASINNKSITTNYLADNVLTSDNIKFSQDLITTFDIGNIKTQNGMATISAKDKSLNEVWESIYMQEINTDLQKTAPSCSMSGNSTKYYLVGATSEEQTITLGLNKGSYDYGYGYVTSKDEADPVAGTAAVTRVTDDGTGVVPIATSPYTLTYGGTKVNPVIPNGNVFYCEGTKKKTAPTQIQCTGAVKYEKAGNPVSNLGKIYPAQAYANGGTVPNTQTLARWYYPFYQGFTVDSDVIADPANITATQLKALNEANMTTYRFSDDAENTQDSDRPGTTEFVDANAYNKKKITKATAANAWRQYFLAYPKSYGFDMSAAKDSNNIDCTVRQATDVNLTFNGVNVAYTVYYINNATPYGTKTITWTLNTKEVNDNG